MTRYHVLAITLFAAGCSSKDTKPSTAQPAVANTATPAPTPAPDPNPSAPKAPALPAELTKVANGRALQAGPFSWPEGGTSAVVGDAKGEDSNLVWHTASGEGEIHLPRAVANTAMKDLTKDGKSELVLFAKPPAEKPEWFQDQTMAWLVGIDPHTKKPARMWLLEASVLGAPDEASLDKEVATLGTFSAAKGTSPIKMIARLPNATPADLQALVGKPGLKLCKRQGEKKSCKTVAAKAIDAKKAKQIVDTAGVIASFEPDPDSTEPAEALQVPACEPNEKNAKELDCSSSVGGPSGGSWIFEQTDAGVRLSEVWTWAEDS